MNKWIVLITTAFITNTSQAADTVPYTANYVKYAGSGFIEIVGPGKIQVNEEVFPYEKIIYISAKNIDSISSIGEGDKGCMLHYSSEGYTENISLVKQTCKQVLEVVGESRN